MKLITFWSSKVAKEQGADQDQEIDINIADIEEGLVPILEVDLEKGVTDTKGQNIREDTEVQGIFC